MRARNLKPGFFQNECLAELPIPARLLFAGLWCMADRAGRLEDRPRRIKMQIFPADVLDVEPLLQGLVDQQLIVRYSVVGHKYISIPSFLKHQRPHSREAESVIPPPEGGEPPPQRGGMFHEELESTAKVGAEHDLGMCEPALNPSSLNPESPLRPPKGGERFSDFWQAYPRRIRKAAAMRAWLRKGLNSKADVILAHLAERVRRDAQWLAEGGRYIPHPATWLNGDGWLDEYETEPTGPRIAGI